MTTLPTAPIDRAKDVLDLTERGVLVPPRDYAGVIEELLKLIPEAK